MENKWIKVSFSGARLPYYSRRRSSKGELFFCDDYFKSIDYVHHSTTDVSKGSTGIVSKRDIVSPETILTDIVEDGEPYSDIFHPMRLHPIANMLIVLCGGCPVSEYHPRLVNGEYEKRDPIYDEIVNNGFVKLTAPFKYTMTDKDGVEKERLITNLTKWSKSAPSNKREEEREDSDVMGNISWFALRIRYTGDVETYNYIYGLLQRYTGVENLEERFFTVTEAIMYIERTTPSAFVEFKSELGKNRLLSLYNGTFFRPSGINRVGAVSERGGKMNCISLTGTFLFNLPKQLVDEAKCGPHFATYLDGGFASLEKWDKEFGISDYFFDDVREEEFEVMGYKRLINIFNKTEEL